MKKVWVSSTAGSFHDEMEPGRDDAFSNRKRVSKAAMAFQLNMRSNAMKRCISGQNMKVSLRAPWGGGTGGICGGTGTTASCPAC